jgi:hypothetical protein
MNVTVIAGMPSDMPNTVSPLLAEVVYGLGNSWICQFTPARHALQCAQTRRVLYIMCVRNHIERAPVAARCVSSRIETITQIHECARQDLPSKRQQPPWNLIKCLDATAPLAVIHTSPNNCLLPAA